MVHSAIGQDVAEHVKQSCAQGNCVLDRVHPLCKVRSVKQGVALKICLLKSPLSVDLRNRGQLSPLQAAL